MIDLTTWPGDHIDGNPCCMWPVYIQGIMKAQGLSAYATDLKGYGIPSHGLPIVLQCFGKNGWRIREDPDSLVLVVGNRFEQRNEQGCRAYLAKHAARICEALEAWKQWQVLP